MSYLDSGGSVYLEGVEIGYYHAPGQAYNYGLWNYLGTLWLGDGNSTNNVSLVKGQNVWFGTGMQFGYPYGQLPDSWVDILGPAGTGSAQPFVDQTNQGRVVSYIPSGQPWRTITSGVCFCAFSEDAPLSTQQRLMARIMGFLLAEDAIPPAAVVDVTAQVVGVSLELSWAPVTQDSQGNPESMDSYVVERGTSPKGRWTPIGVAANPGFTDGGSDIGDPAVNSYYRIRAVDTSGNVGAEALAGEFDFALNTQ
ncbi:hypothetical protein JXA88_09855 [Candidatus Fermentibacteria bacterium]|nr:hypothetical protein [Candidatus Fermentibacteria bacterium]